VPPFISPQIPDILGQSQEPPAEATEADEDDSEATAKDDDAGDDREAWVSTASLPIFRLRR
jgi:hypothetical protein